MSEPPCWDERYRQDRLPWDTGRPDTYLVRLVSAWPKIHGRVLEIGCGTGTNLIWLARQGFRVTGLDVSEEAIAIARQRVTEARVEADLFCADFLEDAVEDRFLFIFDRGCFHSACPLPEQRSRFVDRVADCLEEDGLWFSLIGNRDDVVRDSGPPRWSAREITAAVEERFEILRLESCLIESRHEPQPRFWQCLLRRR